MDFSFDEINELLEFFPDTLRQDPLLESPLHHHQQQQPEIPHTTSPIQPINVETQNTSTIASGSNNEDTKNGHSLKRIFRRETERQRRKEMATLYRALRSLLPLERLKEKRSSSAHIQETVGYIKELQCRIETLSLARDKSKTQMRDSRFDHSTTMGTDHSQNLRQTSVEIMPSMIGFEVLMNAAIVGLQLSGVLNILSKEGLSIVMCNSSKVDHRLLLSIETKVNDGMCIDPIVLEQKLIDYCEIMYSLFS